MPIVPSKKIDKVIFYENHNATWSTNAVAIGTSTTEVTALTTKTTAARAAFNAQQLAHEQARTATNAWYTAVAAMADAGSDVLKKIKAKAATDGVGVYDLALIPPPATPSPVPAPGTPSNFKVALEPDGSLTLKWKCANPAGSQGTTYQVFRKIGAASAFSFLGVTGLKKFPDTTLPNGSSQVTYQIVAVRSTVLGTAAQFIVNFGVGGSGEMTASIVESPRMAA